MISRDQLSAGQNNASGSNDEAHRVHIHAAPIPPVRIGGIAETDLRGLRVDEALSRLDEAVDLAAAEGRDEIRVIHGIGTGALRSAVRDHLPHSHHILEWVEANRDEGGAGATRGILKKD